MYEFFRFDSAGRRLMPTEEFFELVKRLPQGSHFKAKVISENWERLSESDAAHPSDKSAEAWQGYDLHARLMALVANETRALRITVMNMFADTKTDFTPVWMPGMERPEGESKDDEFSISSAIPGMFSVD